MRIAQRPLHILMPPRAVAAITVAGVESGSAGVRAGDAIPVRIGETTRFTSTDSAPLELFVMGVAREMAAKTQLLTGAQR